MAAWSKACSVACHSPRVARRGVTRAPVVCLQVKRFSSLFAMPARVRESAAAKDYEQVGGWRVGSQRQRACVQASTSLRVRGMRVASCTPLCSVSCSAAPSAAGERCTVSQRRPCPPPAATQVCAEYKKANALIRPGPATPKVWASLHTEIEERVAEVFDLLQVGGGQGCPLPAADSLHADGCPGTLLWLPGRAPVRLLLQHIRRRHAATSILVAAAHTQPVPPGCTCTRTHAHGG